MVNKLLNNSKRLTKRSKKKMKLKILAIQRSQAKSQLAKKKMILLRNSIERATTKSRKLNLINKPLKRRKIPLHLKAKRMTRNRLNLMKVIRRKIGLSPIALRFLDLKIRREIKRIKRSKKKTTMKRRMKKRMSITNKKTSTKMKNSPNQNSRRSSKISGIKAIIKNISVQPSLLLF